MIFSGIEVLLLFFLYSFIGWIYETVAAAVKQKRFVNKGLVNLPFCTLYGGAAIFITVFAAGCSVYKVLCLLGIGAFLGDITETIYCRITAGVWMSRSSVVWGPFSIVWGLAIAVFTVLLYKYKDSSDRVLFFAGTVLGGAYEYVCSVFTEIVFGKVFWDYSHIRFNLGGRINLLYCFFWGIAAVVWIKGIYPKVSAWIEKTPIKLGKVLSWIMIVFMCCNMVVSSMALIRSTERQNDIPAEHTWQKLMDERFDDERLSRIYPNAIER